MIIYIYKLISITFLIYFFKYLKVLITSSESISIFPCTLINTRPINLFLPVLFLKNVLRRFKVEKVSSDVDFDTNNVSNMSIK